MTYFDSNHAPWSDHKRQHGSGHFSEAETDDYEPEELVAPTLPTPSREDFIDAKIRLQKRVKDGTFGQGGLAKSYRYSPLKEHEIRLIELAPGEGDSEIICRMLYRSLDNVAQKYYALSYHWGIDVPTNRITIRDDRLEARVVLPNKNTLAAVVSQLPTAGNSNRNDRWFSVRDNLFGALRTLRKKDKPMRLWVDAICINQDAEDEFARKEKQKQVGNMARIYNTAYAVCIWLGNGSATTDNAIAFMKEMVTRMPTLDKLLGDPEREEDWMAFRDLMTFKWFSRRWVVQEVALARRAYMYCGEKVCPRNPHSF
jgi:hypothetical protein